MELESTSPDGQQGGQRRPNREPSGLSDKVYPLRAGELVVGMSQVFPTEVDPNLQLNGADATRSKGHRC